MCFSSFRINVFYCFLDNLKFKKFLLILPTWLKFISVLFSSLLIWKFYYAFHSLGSYYLLLEAVIILFLYFPNKNITCYYATTKAPNTYCDVAFNDGDYIMFGKETAGLPEELLYKNKQNCIRIPMIDEARSLNLANSVAIVVYEALRQTDFSSLLQTGQLTKFTW